MDEQELPTIMQCQRCGCEAELYQNSYSFDDGCDDCQPDCQVFCTNGNCYARSDCFLPSNFLIDDEKSSGDRPILMAANAAINDWNSLQELIRKGKQYDEMKALLTAMIPAKETTKSRSL